MNWFRNFLNMFLSNLFRNSFRNNLDWLWWSKCLFCFNHSFDTIVHILNKIYFWSTESTFVWDIINMVICLSVFAMCSSDLNIESISNYFKLRLLLAKQWQVNVDWSTESSAKVSWTWCDIPKVFRVSKFSYFFNLRSSTSKSAKHTANIRTLLHWNNSELVLFVNPSEECLRIVMENTSAFWPVTI